MLFYRLMGTPLSFKHHPKSKDGGVPGQGHAGRRPDHRDPKDIATELFLSYGTVRNYLASAMTKLNARNRVDAICIATEAGWL